MNTCIGCGYDLQQLPVQGVCPECGTPIEESLRGPLLENADPQWLSRITLGQTLLSWSFLVSALGAVTVLVGFPIALMAGSSAGAGRAFEALIGAILLGLGFVIIIALIASAAGALLVTTQEPKEREREPPLSARHLGRWGIFAIVGIQLIFAPLSALPLSPPVAMPIAVVQIVLTAAAVTVTAIPLLRFLGGLAKRIPDEKLAKKTRDSERTLRWAIPLFALLMFAPRLPAGWGATGMSVTVVLRSVAGCATLIVGILLIVQAVTLAVAMFAFRRAFRRCQDAAGRVISPARAGPAPRP